MQVRLHFGERVLPIRLFDVGLEDTAYPFLLFVSQAETETVLNEHLAGRGIEVERAVSWSASRRRRSRSPARFATGTAAPSR